MEVAMIEVTVSEARENLADLLGKVQHSGERVRVFRHGKPVAVIVSYEEHEFLEKCEDLHWGPIAEEAYQEYLKDPGAAKTIEEIMAEEAGLDKGVKAAG
jgi:prevent-host-death family protein